MEYLYRAVNALDPQARTALLTRKCRAWGTAIPRPGQPDQFPISRKNKGDLGMSNSTPAMPGGVILDWTHARTGPPEPCVFGDGPTVCRSPVKDVPCHKACAETWITTTPLTRPTVPGSSAPTPRLGVRGERLPGHLPRAVCPDCGASDITESEVETGDGITEIALICTACGTAWPVACVVDWSTRP